MSGFRAVELFNLAIPCDGEPVPALIDLGFPATFRVTMAAIDPTLDSKAAANGEPAFVGSTLRMIRVPEDDDEDDDESDLGEMDMAELLDDENSEQDEEDEEEDDDEDGDPGPSDPSKSPKAKRLAALKEALTNGVSDDDDDDDDMEVDSSLTAKDKGKGKAIDLDDSDDDSDEIEGPSGAQEFVLCTLDPSKCYQQALDFTVNEHEVVYFSAMGTHDIYLTGNILIPQGSNDNGGDMYDSDSDDEEYDLEPAEDELGYDDEDESDELDDVRITELDSDEGEGDTKVPKLIEAPPASVKAEATVSKGKNKRPRDEDSDIETPEKPTVDSTLNKSLKPEDASSAPEADAKLSKSQLKKLRKKMKDNSGNAAEPIVKAEDKGVKEIPVGKTDKKVQFAKTLVQGPSGAAQPNGAIAKTKTEVKATAGAAAKSNGATKGERVVQGVRIDDRKLGSGPAAKKGDKVSMRYIGKLESDKKVFDSNTKGQPFIFKLGAGEVIKGWEIGIQGMTVGGERRITVPAHLAYGSKSQPGIPANSTLIFDVKCLEVK